MVETAFPLVDEARHDGPAIPIRLVAPGADIPATAALHDFTGQTGRVLLLGEAEGGPLVLLGAGDAEPRASLLRGAAAKLPPGLYRLEAADGIDPAAAALAWAQGAYAFERFKTAEPKPRARLAVSAETLARAEPLARACALARDLVNTPANAMGPVEIEDAVRAVAQARGAEVQVTAGEALETGYPSVHAVGRAAAPHRQPRMIELTWAPHGAGETAPNLVLVGKGVAFDTGGWTSSPRPACAG